MAIRASNHWGGGHLFQMEPFGPVLGLPIGFEIGPECLNALHYGLRAHSLHSTGNQLPMFYAQLRQPRPDVVFSDRDRRFDQERFSLPSPSQRRTSMACREYSPAGIC